MKPAFSKQPGIADFTTQRTAGPGAARRRLRCLCVLLSALASAISPGSPAALAAGGWQVSGTRPTSVTELSVADLVTRLTSVSAEARIAAAEQLGFHGVAAKGAVPALEGLASDPHAGVRLAAATALWDITGKSEVPVQILSRLVDTGSAEIRPVAACVLGSMGQPAAAALPALKTSLKNSEGLTRVHLAEAVMKIDPADQQAVPELAELLKNGDSYVRCQAAWALEGAPAGSAEQAHQALEQAREDSDPQVQIAVRTALNALVQLAPAEEPVDSTAAAEEETAETNGPDTVAVAESDKQPEQKATWKPRNGTAAQSTPVSGNRSLVDLCPAAEGRVRQLVQQLEDANPSVRRESLEALSMLGDEGMAAAPAVRQLLQDEDPVVRATAASTCWDLTSDSREAAPVLAALLDTTTPGIRTLCAMQLGRMGHGASSALPDLERTMHASDGLVQIHVAEAVIQIGGNQDAAAATLVGKLDSEDAVIRTQAAYALRGLSAETARRVRPVLVNLCSDEDPRVAMAAQVSLASLGEAAPQALPEEEAGPVLAVAQVPAPAAPAAPAVEGRQPRSPLPPPVAPTRPPEVELPADRAESDPLAGVDLSSTPITQVSIDIRVPVEKGEDGKPLPLPRDLAAEWLEGKYAPQYACIGRPWCETVYHWAATGFCHQPLYFEEVNLERYGYRCPVLQPAISGASFFGNVALMPYNLGAEPVCDCFYTLGHYRPGDCVPYQHHRKPLSLKGALYQGATIWTGIAVIR